MLKDGQGPDVTFSVVDQLFHAHRDMLAARSPVFKAELFGEMRENDAHRIINIDDMEPSILGALLHFVYTDTIPNNYGVDKDASFQHLFVAADRYGLDRLRAMCERKLCQDIDVDTVSTTLSLAEQHHCVQLKNACLGFISFHGVLSTTPSVFIYHAFWI
jgi:speckle-type POZ protein